MASPCRLRPTASGPRRCRRLGPALGLQQPRPAQPPATPPSPPADAVALSKRNRPAGDPSCRGPARIPAWLRREILDRSPGVPPHSPVLRTREMPSARPHPGGSFIPLRGSASPPETCGSGPASKAVPGQARHLPCLRRSGRGLRRLGGWTPPAAPSWPAARRPAWTGDIEPVRLSAAGAASQSEAGWGRLSLPGSAGRCALPALLDVGPASGRYRGPPTPPIVTPMMTRILFFPSPHTLLSTPHNLLTLHHLRHHSLVLAYPTWSVH